MMKGLDTHLWGRSWPAEDMSQHDGLPACSERLSRLSCDIDGGRIFLGHVPSYPVADRQVMERAGMARQSVSLLVRV
jgi:hypothetical protein